MIQAIIHYPNKELLLEVFEITSIIPVSISKMTEGHYLVVGYPKQANPLEELLKSEPITYIGTWNMDGTIYKWTTEDVLNEEGNVVEKDKDVTYRNYTPEKYLSALDDIVKYNDKGEEISRDTPTMEYAMDTQVSKVSGNPNRILQ